MKTLYGFQEQSVEKMVELGGRGALFNDVGTGKTLTALEVARRLDVGRILVVCPMAVAPVWADEVASQLPDVSFVDATLGTVKTRAAYLDDHATDRALVTVGYESYWRYPLSAAIEDWKPDMIIYDEAHRLKGRSTRASRYAHHLRDVARHVLALTATPMPNGVEDLFAIYRAIRPDVFGDRWADFEDTFLRVTRRHGFPLIIGYRNREVMEKLIHKTAVRITKEQALDLPEEVEVPIALSLSPRTQKVYDELKKHAVAEVDGLDGEHGRALSRVVVTNILRLMQVTSGFVKVEDGREVVLGTEKLDVLKSLLEDVLPRRVVVFCHFTMDVKRAAETARTVAENVYVLAGPIPEAERRRSIAAFREDKSAVLVCQIQVSALGIDLSCADVSVFLSADYNFMNYTQSRGRLHRHGQQNKVTHYLLSARKTIDERIYSALTRKGNLSREILDTSAAKELFA